MGKSKEQALDAIPELTLADCLRFFDAKATERDKQISALADNCRKIDNDGGTERDNDLNSEGDDNGAYVLTWTWVSFEGTALDKDKEGDDEADAD